MTRSHSTLRRWISGLIVITQVSAPLLAYAAPLTINPKPLYATGEIPPIVMLNLSKDHQLHFKAYNDYSDLDNDGLVETTYKHSIDYYGYFDSGKCYTYSTSNNRFEPVSITTDKYCGGSKGWAGNFLNWATTTRMDAVRKLLYGGLRSTDTASDTVLERSYLPMDAHSFAKFYNGSDLTQLVPTFSNLSQTVVSGTSATTITLPGTGGGSIKPVLTGITDVDLGDQIEIVATADTTKKAVGWVTAWDASKKEATIQIPAAGIAPGAASFKTSSWTVRNLTPVGITLCNTTPGSGSGANNLSHTNALAPELRVVRGNYSLWTANERWQCNWRENKSGTITSASSNGNAPLVSLIDASSENPSQSNRALGTGSVQNSGSGNGTYFTRVQACNTALLGTEKCKAYPSGTNTTVYKPVGLLQVYGDGGLMRFGLLTGSYDKNISGGIVRSLVGSMRDEVNDNGTFKLSSSGVGSIIFTINRLRMYGYDYSNGYYNDKDSCNYQQIGLVTSGGANSGGSPANEGNCSTWGNPLAEMYLESLRYLANNTTPLFRPASTPKDDALGLPKPNWTKPLTQANYCSPLNTIVFNPATGSYDSDSLSSTSDINLTSSKTAASLTDQIGADEGINGNAWFFGGTNGACDAKTLTALGSLRGLCPEAPSQLGSYLISGLAWHAHTNRITTEFTPSLIDKRSLKVDTYAVQLASNVPKIDIDVGGKKVTIMPAYRLDYGGNGTKIGTGTIVDFKVVRQTSTGGRFYVNWEDSNQGGDFDQDVWGIIDYQINGDQLQVTTAVVAESTVQPQGFGYTISGIDKDGVHFHSGIEGFNYTDSTNLSVTPTTNLNSSGGCSNCQVGQAATTATYTVLGTKAGQLKDPLWYAAKWGGFRDLNGVGKPRNKADTADDPNTWDIALADGRMGRDGNPDNYFFVQNPAALEDSLERAFTYILATSSASSVATNSTSLNDGSRVFQARFNGNDWSGQLLRFDIDENTGVVATAEEWDAGVRLNDATDPIAKPSGVADRRIYTWDDDSSRSTRGIPFRWDSATDTTLNTAQRGALDKLPGLSADGFGQKRVQWLRGDRSNEGYGAGKFRKRNTSVLGDIINSNPQFVGAPRAGYNAAGYATFRADNAARPPMIYVGANDGMLHGFDAVTGDERLAYVPAKLIPQLSALTNQNYSHAYYVDGTPEVNDVNIGGNWKTVLVGGLNGGGQGMYALDITNPADWADETKAGQLVLWEFTDADDADLGYTYGRPQIVRMANGKWAAVFGNGYNNTEADGAASTSGKGYVYVVMFDKTSTGKNWVLGTDYFKLATPTGNTSDPNGITHPFPADIDSDGVVDFIYAGDIGGKVWKWDVRNADPAKWSLANGGLPLFSATNAAGDVQPITSGLEVMKHPQGGYMVLFGTGMYIQPSDPKNLSVQSFYGIRDLNGPIGSTVTRSELQKQEILSQQLVLGDLYRLSTTSDVNYPSQKGWYMDLQLKGDSARGERVVYSPLLRSGRIIFNTLIPSDAPCDLGGTSWLMELDALNGKQLPVSPFDVDKNGGFSKADMIDWTGNSNWGKQYASGRQSQIGITPTPTVIGAKDSTTKEFKIMSGSSGRTESVAESASGRLGRLSWREVMQ